MRKFFGCQCQKMVKRNAVNRFHIVLKKYRVFYSFVSYYNCQFQKSGIRTTGNN
jgi:hypothetical protein